LQKMVNLCLNTVSNLNLKINESKSSCTKIGPSFQSLPSEIIINNTPLKWNTSFAYLGLRFNAGKTLSCDLHLSKTKFFASLNSILSKLGSNPSIPVALSLIDSKCAPILFYALEAIPLSKKQISNLDFTYNAQFAKLFHTFDTNIIKHCQYYSGFLPANFRINSLRINFLHRITTGQHPQLKFLFKHVGQDDLSCIPSIFHQAYTSGSRLRLSSLLPAFAEHN
jgi:hypothetical protein